MQTVDTLMSMGISIPMALVWEMPVWEMPVWEMPVWEMPPMVQVVKSRLDLTNPLTQLVLEPMVEGIVVRVVRVVRVGRAVLADRVVKHVFHVNKKNKRLFAFFIKEYFLLFI